MFTSVSSAAAPNPATSILANQKAATARAADGDYKTSGAGHRVKDADGDYKPTPASNLATPAVAGTTLAALSGLKFGG